jgi:hypothetical protein
MPADHSNGDSPMPVTAKLSRKFYDTFGDEIANELVEWFNQVDATYRADLLQLNELNFDRFDAKLDQRITQSGAELSACRADQVDVRVLGRHGGAASGADPGVDAVKAAAEEGGPLR